MRRIQRAPKQTLLMIALVAAGLSLPALVAAHCDSLDGPVVHAAQAALATGEVDLVLGWVFPEHDQAVRSAFARVLHVRAQGEEARELADLWFFETVVRLHREGEGAPYTGLKPEGWEPPALIVAADRALEEGEIDGLADRVAAHVARELREKYREVKALEARDPSDVEATRRYVTAYVEYTHLLEALHHLLHQGDHGH